MTGAELAARSRAEQNLPAHVEDVGALARIAALLKISKKSAESTTPLVGSGAGNDSGSAGSRVLQPS